MISLGRNKTRVEVAQHMRMSVERVYAGMQVKTGLTRGWHGMGQVVLLCNATMRFVLYGVHMWGPLKVRECWRTQRIKPTKHLQEGQLWQKPGSFFFKSGESTVVADSKLCSTLS